MNAGSKMIDETVNDGGCLTDFSSVFYNTLNISPLTK